MRHFRGFWDISPEETTMLVDFGLRVKADHIDEQEKPLLGGNLLCLLFDKPSMRTRVSFEAAMAHQGGRTLYLTGAEVGLGQRESVADFARVISTYIDILAVRTFKDAMIEELAEHASVPVINALTDTEHPCQVLADLCTIEEEFGRLAGVRVAWVGDSNNVARSLAIAGRLTGLDLVISSPDGYGLPKEFCDRVAASPGRGKLTLTTDPLQAVRDAHVIYTDVWTSMGQESEKAARHQVFRPYQVNDKLMAIARPEAVFMHCLPAHRGEEVTAPVIDGPQSVVVRQAENRLHAQKALMLWLLGKAWR